MTFLHGAGDLGALGLPLPLLLLLAAGAVPALAAVLSARARGMEGRPPPRFRPLPRWLRAVCDGAATRMVARGVALLALVGVLAIAGAGTDGMTGNAAPRLALVVLWGGVAAASVLLGPVWRAVSPFRTLARWIGRVTDPDEVATRPVPAGAGVWPAVVTLLAWAWVAEAAPTPRAVLYLLLGYGAVQVAAGSWYGQAWFSRGDAIEVLSTLLGRMAPLGRDHEGRLAVRNPLSALAGLEPEPGLRGFVAVMLAWELAHAIRETEGWPLLLADLGLSRGAGATTLALLASIAATAAAVRLATPRRFLMAATVPLLAGWLLSHHVGPMVIDWRAALVDLADPFARGWSLYEITGPPIEPVAPGAAALAQLLLLVAGVLVAVVAAHRMAVARYDLRAARAVQFPLRMVLIAAVITGVLLQSAVAV